MNSWLDQAIIRIMLDRYGETHAHEAGIRLEGGTPAALFQLLCLTLLLGTSISARQAANSTRALIGARLTTARSVAASSREQRLHLIAVHADGERTAAKLGELAQFVLRAYDGDLRQLRRQAEYDLRREHSILKTFEGMGLSGADRFLGEVQGEWAEVAPFAGTIALRAADELGLGTNVFNLNNRVRRPDFVHLVAALGRVSRGNAYLRVRTMSAIY
jgi:hypothetical protein